MLVAWMINILHIFSVDSAANYAHSHSRITKPRLSEAGFGECQSKE